MGVAERCGSGRDFRIVKLWNCEIEGLWKLKEKSMTRNELEDRIVRFASRCVKVCGALPAKKIGSGNFADQLFRSSTSVAANYAESAEAESRKDFIHKLKIAMKELSETRVWLKIISEADYVPKSKLEGLIGEAEELARILSSSIITARGALSRIARRQDRFPYLQDSQ